jgi:hypothetical protein
VIKKQYVSWGMYGGSNSTQRANGLVSWGLFSSLPTPPTAILFKYVHMFKIAFLKGLK